MDVDQRIADLIEEENKRMQRITKLQLELSFEKDPEKEGEIAKELIKEYVEGYAVNRSIVMYLLKKIEELEKGGR